jgi:ribosomal protein S27AE
MINKEKERQTRIKWKKKNRGKITLQDREYRRRNKEKVSSWSKNWKKNNHDATIAHQALHRAIDYGLIQRPDACSKCGASDVLIDGHHEDYSKPLDVEWLCTSCHRLLHAA